MIPLILSTIGVSLLEGLTEQLDNLCLPLYYYTLFIKLQN